jgi:putative FmdB family regulatory protein
MPVFDYQCTECSRTYDVFHKGHEIKDDITCPQCGSKSHKRLISAPNISTRGSVKTAPMPNGSGCASGMCGLN